MDLKSGLVGSKQRTESGSGKQAGAGRNLCHAPRGTDGMFGEAWKEQKESERADNEGPDKFDEGG